MAKDYFQDILPPEDSPRRRVPQRRAGEEEQEIPIRKHVETDEEREVIAEELEATPRSERSIRNISVPERRRAHAETSGYMISPPRRSGARWLLWVAAGGSVVLLGILALVALRSTTVDVTPRTQAVTFSDASQFTAYPSDGAASGALSYSTRTLDLDDSEVVQSSGMVQASDKASGTITIYNDYSSAPVKFIATTRFQAATGQIFRAPAAVTVPGKTAAGPGTVTITVVADQPGESYNVPPGKFTVPGLKSSPSEYAKVYAMSTSAMSGGFVGQKPGVDESTMSAAKAAIRGRLEAKARNSIKSSAGDLVLPDLVQIQYVDDAPTPEANNSVRVHETAHVIIPSFSQTDFAAAVAASVGVTDGPLTFLPGNGFSAALLSASSTPGTAPLQFSLSGSGTLVWSVDSVALQKALAGKTQAAFQGIVKNFQGIQEAHARIEPFWSSTFPSDPSAIKITVEKVDSQ